MQHKNSRRLALILGATILSTSAAFAQSKLMPSQSAKVALGNLPMRAMWAIESNDLTTLSKLAHSKGIRFSSVVYVDKDDLNFLPAQIRKLGNGKKYQWGTYVESGEPESSSWNNYRKYYLWARDFSKGKLSFNTFKERGGKINNLRESYTDAIFVESYWPGTPYKEGKKITRNDIWGGLWTIWKKENGKWKLRGIANNYMRL